MITSDAVSLQVNPLQCGYFSQLIGEDGEVVISQIDAGQMLHSSHSVRQFGKNISLQVQFCNTFQDMSEMFVHQQYVLKCSIALQNVLFVQSASFSTFELSEGGKELAGEGLHLVVSQSDKMDVV